MSINGLGNHLPAILAQQKNKGDVMVHDDSRIADAVANEEGKSSNGTLTEAPEDIKSTSSNPMQELRDYMNMSYAEKLQWSWMAARGISKSDFEAMSGEEKQKIVDQMREDLKTKMGQHQDQRPSIHVTA